MVTKFHHGNLIGGGETKKRAKFDRVQISEDCNTRAWSGRRETRIIGYLNRAASRRDLVGKGVVTIVMAVFFNCSFARAAVKSYTTDLSGKNHALTDGRRAERLGLFKTQFSFTAGEISANPHLENFGKATESQQTFDRHCSSLMKVFSRTWPGRAKQRDAFMAQFKPASWRKLPRLQQLSHNVSDCYACAHKFQALHTAFPVRATTTPKNSVTPMAFKLAGKIKNTTEANKQAAADKTAKSILKDITNKMNEYKETFGQDITEQWLNQSGGGLQLTPTRAERLKARKEIEKDAKKEIQASLVDADFNKLYGSACSKTSYAKHRLDEGLEPKHEAEHREKKKRSHVSLDFDRMTWDWQRLVDDARTWEDGRHVNWQDVSRQYGVHQLTDPGKLAANGGQIVQAVLQHAGIDIERFRNAHGQELGTPRVRRSAKRLKSGVAVPMHTSIADLEKKKESLYENGTLVRPINIVEREYKQIRFTPDSCELQETTKKVFGQKLPLHELASSTLNHLAEQGLLATQHFNTQNMTPIEVEERLADIGYAVPEGANKSQTLHTLQTTVNLMNWGDHSALSGHGYLVYMIAPMYDPAVFANPNRSEAEVQRIVEQPRTYMIAMSADTCQDKLMYIADRRSDIQLLKVPITATSLNTTFNVQMRAFKGDNPEQEFELGVNQSGHFKCSGCSAETSTFGSLSTALAAKRLSVADRQEIAIAGVFGKIAGRAKPFDGLKRADKERELQARGLSTTGNVGALNERLRETLLGTQRVLSLMFATPQDSPNQHNLGNYEIFSSEGLHDIKDHIKNILHELPCHLDDESKKAFAAFYEKELGSRAMARGSDYRRAVLKLPAVLKNTASTKVNQLVNTLAELSLLLYITEEDRSPRLILRLYNVAFLHGIYCNHVLKPVQQLSPGVVFGLYFHKLTKHAAEETRCVSGYT